MNAAGQSIRVGLFFILGVALIYTVFTVIGNQGIAEQDGIRLQAAFDDLKTLSPGADVRVAGVRIGQVVETRLEGGRGVAELLIDQRYAIPADSVAKISMASFLGTYYVALEYGTASAPLADGMGISTAESADLNTILSQVGEIGEKLSGMAEGLSNFGGGDMNALFSNLNDLVTENRGEVDNLLSNLDAISTKLNSGQGTLGKLIADDTLYNELQLTVTTIREAAEGARGTLQDAQVLMGDLREGQGTIGRLLTDDTIANDFEVTMANLREFSDRLNSEESTLGLLLSDDSLYYDLRGMMNKAEQALDTMGDSGPITAAGAISGALF